LRKLELHEPLRCPVCRAPWKDDSTCPRCGSDLTFLSTLRQKARCLFHRALRHARQGEDCQALALVDESLGLFCTRQAAALKITLHAKLKQYDRMLRCIKMAHSAEDI
jgi:hypothetical protein